MIKCVIGVIFRMKDLKSQQIFRGIYIFLMSIFVRMGFSEFILYSMFKSYIQ